VVAYMPVVGTDDETCLKIMTMLHHLLLQ